MGNKDRQYANDVTAAASALDRLIGPLDRDLNERVRGGENENAVLASQRRERQKAQDAYDRALLQAETNFYNREQARQRSQQRPQKPRRWR